MSTPSSTTYSGFSTSVSVSNTPILCTGCSLKINQRIIYSSAIFSGNSTQKVNQMPRMDYADVGANLDFQCTNSVWDMFCGLLSNRTSSVSLNITASSSYSNNSLYLQNLSFQTAQNQLLTGSVSLKGADKASTIYPNFSFSVLPSSTSTFSDANGISQNLIPYYRTSVSGCKKVLGWSFNVSQPITFKTFCNAASVNSNPSDANKPSYVAFGLMNCTLNVTQLIESSGFCVSSLHSSINYSSTQLSDSSSIVISCTSCTSNISLSYIHLLSVTPNLANLNDYPTCQCQYAIHQLNNLSSNSGQ